MSISGHESEMDIFLLDRKRYRSSATPTGKESAIGTFVRDESDPANCMKCWLPRLISRLRKARMRGAFVSLSISPASAFFLSMPITSMHSAAVLEPLSTTCSSDASNRCRPIRCHLFRRVIRSRHFVRHPGSPSRPSGQRKMVRSS